MANIAIGNIGNRATPPTYGEQGVELTPFVPADPSPEIKITDANGVVKVLAAGMSAGLALWTYTIEVV